MYVRQCVLPIIVFYWYRGECRLELAITFTRCNRTKSRTTFSLLYKGQEMQAPQHLCLFRRPSSYPRTQLPLFPHPQGCVGISRVGHFDKEHLRPQFATVFYTLFLHSFYISSWSACQLTAPCTRLL